MTAIAAPQVFEASGVRIAHPSPPHCSACFQAKPHMRHVDFGAGWDGPMLPALDGAVGVIGHSIDELIICEECLAIAGRLLELEDVAPLHRELTALEASNDTLHKRVAELEDALGKDQAAQAARAKVFTPASGPAGPRRRGTPPPVKPKPSRAAAKKKASSS